MTGIWDQSLLILLYAQAEGQPLIMVTKDPPNKRLWFVPLELSSTFSFNIQELCTLPTHCIYMFGMILRKLKGLCFLDRNNKFSLEGRCSVYFEIVTIYITFMLQTVKPAKMCNV